AISHDDPAALSRGPDGRGDREARWRAGGHRAATVEDRRRSVARTNGRARVLEDLARRVRAIPGDAVDAHAVVEARDGEGDDEDERRGDRGAATVDRRRSGRVEGAARRRARGEW